MCFVIDGLEHNMNLENKTLEIKKAYNETQLDTKHCQNYLHYTRVPKSLNQSRQQGRL